MQIETTNILIGAGIALVSSVITAVVTHIFQARSDRQKRKWEVEDRNGQRLLEIEENRLLQAEKWAEGYVRMFDESKAHLMTLAGKLSDANEFKVWIKGMTEAPKSHSVRRAVLYRLNDAELLGFANELDKSWAEMVEVLSLKSSGDEQLDQIGLMYLLSVKYGEVLQTFGKFIKRLDQIRSGTKPL